MIPTPQLVRPTLTDARFGAPCSEADLAEAERRLGRALAESLRQLYRAFDGFTCTTAAEFLFPVLLPRPGSSNSLVADAEFLRGEDDFPSFVRAPVPIGIDGGGNYWLVFCDGTDRTARGRTSWGDDLELGPLRASWERAARGDVAR